MATTSTPYGLKPVNLLGGKSYAGSVRQISIASGYAVSIKSATLWLLSLRGPSNG